jgi:LmbE family N-acetylglucosaminyl deacetylase
MERASRLGVALALASLPGLIGIPPSVAAGRSLEKGLPQPAAEVRSQKSSKEPVDLDILFVGAHPDDEAFNLSTFGQWAEYDDARIGVLTITRGEGGGNAVGPEEGPALGLLREAEERRAVGKAFIENVFYLDKVDFYYNVSAPLTEDVWGHESTLRKVVRVVRSTRPDVVITMNPSPTPGQHGHHQYAARMSVEAYAAAADRDAFPGQIRREGLTPWRVQKLYQAAASGEAETGPGCPETFDPEEPTDMVFGVFSGRFSERYGTTWAAVARDAQRLYRSQGWFVFPDEPTDPELLACNFYTLIDSRVPFDPESTRRRAVFEGALESAPGGLPVDTELFLSTRRFRVVAGQPFTVTAHIANNGRRTLRRARAFVSTLQGWSVSGDAQLGVLEPGERATADFEVTPPARARPGRFRLAGTLRAGGRSGTTAEVVEVVPAVRGTVVPLPEVRNFRSWARRNRVPQLDNLIKTLLPIAVGESRKVAVKLQNFSDEARSGEVAIELPEGFEANLESIPYENLAPGERDRVAFRVTNTDPSLPTSNQGGVEGDYDFTVTTSSGSGDAGSQTAALNLVPVTTVPQAGSAPVLDGVEDPGEYPGPTLDAGRLWEGEPAGPSDASGTAKVTWFGNALYFLVDVTDDKLGSVLPRSDAKRHWRVDSVELTIDPQGESPNTSTTFKVGIFPLTRGGGPAGYRDADFHQGPIDDTAPGMRIASEVHDPYDGYTVEAKIPFADLPAAIDPEHMGLNVLIYDSDTKDKTGQTRLGWSTWGGVQGDPYRWGIAHVEGYEPPASLPDEPGDPVFTLTAAKSTASPQSILQSSRDGVPLGAGAPVARSERLSFGPSPRLERDRLIVSLRPSARGGTARVFGWVEPNNTVAQTKVQVSGGAGRVEVNFRLSDVERRLLADGGRALVGFRAAGGGVQALARRVQQVDGGG